MLRSKSPFIVLVSLVAFSFQSYFAQAGQFPTLNRWKASHIGIQLGNYSQNYSQLDYLGLLSITQQNIELNEDMYNFKKSEYYDASFYGSKFGVSFGLIRDTDTKWKRELVFGTKVMFGAELLLEYEDNDNTNNKIEFCLIENSFEVEVMHLFRKDNKAFSLFFGPSLSLGSSFNDELIIFRYNSQIDKEELFAVKSSVQLVAHMHAGAYVNLYDRIGMRIAVQYGCGYSVRNSFQDVMNRSTAISYGIEYRFNREKHMN